MGLSDDPVMQKHIGYFVSLFLVWVACCVVFGGELHRAEFTQTQETAFGANSVQVTTTSGTYKMMYDHVSGSVTSSSYTRTAAGNGPVTSSSSSGSTDYKQCSVGFCDRCYSGGAGAVAMAVFAWICLLAAVVLRALVLAQKHSHVPKIGDNEGQYAAVEKGLNWTAIGFYSLSILAWAAGCMGATGSTDGIDKVVPTGFVYIVLCLIAAGVGVILLSKIHAETGFGSGAGGAAKPSPAAPAPAATPAAAAAPTGANAV